MSFPTAITPIILDTALGHLAQHFMTSAKGDLSTARDAAGHLLAAYNVETDEELQLATDIVSYGFHALEVLGQAAAPDLSLNQKLRLRGSAVSLSREGHKARRKLDQLKRARLTAFPQLQAQAPQPPAATLEDQSETESALGLIKLAKEAIHANAKTGGVQAWTLSRKQRRAAEKIAENSRRNAAEHARRAAAQASPPTLSAPASFRQERDHAGQSVSGM